MAAPSELSARIDLVRSQRNIVGLLNAYVTNIKVQVQAHSEKSDSASSLQTSRNEMQVEPSSEFLESIREFASAFRRQMCVLSWRKATQ
eukprot:320557-Rhodomonas_salina.1